MKSAINFRKYTLLLFKPFSPAGEETSLEYFNVVFNGEIFSGDDLNQKELRELLLTIQCQRKFNQRNAYTLGDKSMEVNFSADKKRVHMVLGEENFFYYSSKGMFIYEIVEPEQLYEKVSELF